MVTSPAEAYAAATATLPREEWTIAPFESWLLASCGACDAERIDAETSPVEGEPERLRALVDALAPEPRDWHRERLATATTTPPCPCSATRWRCAWRWCRCRPFTSGCSRSWSGGLDGER